MLYALEYFHNDNSFVLPDNYRRYNGVLRYSRTTAQSELAVTAHGVPRHLDSDRPGPAARGAERSARPLRQHRPQRRRHHPPQRPLALSYQRHTDSSATRYLLYGLDYGLDLYSNFTYALDDPLSGDQINQVDKRLVLGGSAARDFIHPGGGVTTIGAGFRNDNIGTVAINHTSSRALVPPANDPIAGDVRPVTDDHVAQLSYFAYAQNTFQLGPKLRIIPGIRADLYAFKVASDDPANDGSAHAGIVSPKLEIAYEFSPRFEGYANAGESFHSNDGRGTTIAHDPRTRSAIDASGAPIERVTPLARAKGAELGGRYNLGSRFNTTLTLWQLDIASELTFSGDQGTTSPGFPTRRKGIESATFFHPTDRITFDLDYATSSARYTKYDPAVLPGNHVAGGLNGVMSSGLTYDQGTFFSTLRFRYFGPRALIEDDSVRSAATKDFNLLLGFRGARRTGFGVTLEVLNLFDQKGNDIAYYYPSRLKGEAVCPDGSAATAGCNDIHFHPLDRRGFRFSLTQRM